MIIANVIKILIILDFLHIGIASFYFIVREIYDKIYYIC